MLKFILIINFYEQRLYYIIKQYLLQTKIDFLIVLLSLRYYRLHEIYQII
jgi:hypothetical protein